MKFIDQARIYIKAGDGGHGCIAFLREKFRPKGGPCGGDGGHGGNVIMRVNPQLTTLHDVSYLKHYRAKRGGHGEGNNRHGKNGADIVLFVPPGTIIKNSETQHVIIDLKDLDSEITIAKGGNGGFGNARFKTQKNTAPRVANDGQTGEELTIDLELKVLADVGLVGFPNAGKSTLLSVVSAAKPKVADYPFTTLIPNLGIVKYGDYKSFVMADIPGLIEGASEGKGLGSQFLRHIERTKALVFLVDGNSLDILDEYNKLRIELEKKNPELNTRPSLLLITKKDTWMEDPELDESELKGVKLLFISSLNKVGVREAVHYISMMVEGN
ncbi:MAG: GTPase ObgE [Candidatus Marinimicrobia bacterium]|jgi:GTP-binding protein|nr:GTPase ObgE [Candidatus Neomarinimicrobiota bacterium]MBT3633663.1 GTPase ObgE [Candidatus Neomarinimicrobiota bacterium]MBT3682384.1 GTPase ObgE [Candidatus Neomarinimicrobiota bacterium]MBT3759148.1 GTPase ObgE [Candidatus Neomarinimicrobiota bacterium]MBT3895579.1 GTPase ObgE [Candidatus Neomarinimicrobiota bacterium]